MINNIGNLLQLIALFSGIASIIIRSRKLFLLSSFSVIGTFLLLVYAFIISDFTNQNVFLNSSTIGPVIYKISAAWASHEGSMSLWLSLFSMVAVTAIAREEKIMPILCGIQILFISFIYFTSNPFNALSFKPLQGMGLNPMLQDKALAIHPPILYLGYVTSAIPFALACNLLIKKKVEDQDLKIMLTYTTLALLFMTAGIGLGSWWAYRELGWGGFWFFDPVENISIMPWLSSIAGFHTLLITIKERKLLFWAVVLSLLTFILSLLGMFLVRSGILTSVHSFAFSLERGTYIFLIFSIILGASLYFLSRYDFVDNKSKLTLKEKGIVSGNIIWLTALVVLIIATIFPLIYLLLLKQDITLEADFFIRFFIPFLLLALFMAGIFSFPKTIKISFIIILLSILITVIYNLYFKSNTLTFIGFFIAIFILLQNLGRILQLNNFFKKSLPNKSIAMLTGHIGAGLMLLSIVMNVSLQKEFEFTGPVGGVIKVQGWQVTLKNVYFAEGPNYYRQIAEFWVQDDNKEITILKPENRLYKIEQTLSQESDIYSYLFTDLYAVLSRVEENNIQAKIYYRPMISFLWLSIFIIVLSFLISCLMKK